ncbi:hypothetical protein GA0004736_3399 [Curtobacterium sp. 9128]|nr:hypothetical protein GA0004736_3399 [Curtobacterium sp. 9128]
MSDWHPFNSYEWWRDIGTGLLGVLAALFIGAATIAVAAKSNSIADRTRSFQELVTREEQARNLRETLREARLDRSAVAGKLYEYVAKRREEALGRQFQPSEMPPGLLRGIILDQAKYLGVQEPVGEILDDIDRGLTAELVSAPTLSNTVAAAALLAGAFENRIQAWVREGTYRDDSGHIG